MDAGLLPLTNTGSEPLSQCTEYWAIRSSTRSFARTAHSFAFSALLAQLRYATLIRSLARSLTRFRAHGKEVFVYELNVSISYNSGP